MAISLNNHETRIKKLEESGVSTWQKGSNSNGYWAKETTTGLIIQWNRQVVNSEHSTLSFPIKFTSDNISVTTAIYTDQLDRSEKYPDRTKRITRQGFEYQSITYYWPGVGLSWLAIGYLITDRLLNILYKAFARNIYTHLWQKLVSKIFTS